MVMKPVDPSEIKWSYQALASRNLISRFADSFPVFALVTKGYYGAQEMETLAVDQVVRICHYVTQQRVLARDCRGKHLSFPLDYPLKFRKVKDKRKTGSTSNQVSLSSKTYSLSRLIERHVLPVKVHFDQDEEWEFKIGDQQYTNLDFGTIEIHRQYAEAFLIGNAIHNGIIDDRTLLIPLYLDVHWKYAEALKSNNEENWKSFKNMYGRAVGHINFQEITGSKDVMLCPDENVDIPRPDSWLGPSSISDVSRGPGSMGSDLGSSLTSHRIQPNWTLVLNVDKNTATMRREGASSGADEPIKVSLMQTGLLADMSTTSGIVSSSDHASRIEIKSSKKQRRGSVSSSSSKSTEISNERAPLTRTKSNIVRIRMKDKHRISKQGDSGVDDMEMHVGRRHRSFGPGDARDSEYWELPEYRNQNYPYDDFVPSGQYTGSLIVGGGHRRSRGRSPTRRSKENRIRAVSMDRTRHDRALYDDDGWMDDSAYHRKHRVHYSSSRSVHDTQGSSFGMRVVDEDRRVSSTGDVRVVPVYRGESYLQRSPRLRRRSPQRSEQLLRQGKLVEDYDAYGGYTKYSWDEMQNRIHGTTMPLEISGTGLQWSSSQTKSLTRGDRKASPERLDRSRMQGGSDPNLAKDHTNNMKKIISPYGTLFVSTEGKEVSGNIRSPIRGDPNATYNSLGAPMSDLGLFTHYRSADFARKSDYAKLSNYQHIRPDMTAKSAKTVPIVKDGDGGIEYKGTLTISDKMGQIPKLSPNEREFSTGSMERDLARMDSVVTTVQHTFEAVSTLERKKDPSSYTHQKMKTTSDYATIPAKQISPNYVYKLNLDENADGDTTEVKTESKTSTGKRTTTIISHDMPGEQQEGEEEPEAPEEPQTLQQSETSAFEQVQNSHIITTKSTKQRAFAKSPVINVLTPMINKPQTEQHGQRNHMAEQNNLTTDITKVNDVAATEYTQVETTTTDAARGTTFESTTTRTESEADSVFESLERNASVFHAPPVVAADDQSASPNPPLPSISVTDSSSKYSRVRVRKKSKAGRIDIRSSEDKSLNVSSLREAYKKRSPLRVDGATGEVSDQASGHSSQINALDELNTYLRGQADVDTQSEKSVGPVETNNYNITTAWKV